MKERSIAEQTLFRFSYAVGLWRGAEKIRDSKDPLKIIGLSVYLLIGFAIENALAAYLISHNHPHPGDYKSHDLVRAMRACAKTGLVFSVETIKFIEFLSPLQQDFVFRYPEKMEEIRPPPVEDACRLTKGILRDVDDVLKMKGFSIAEQSDAL
jgi:hypothetical protein